MDLTHRFTVPAPVDEAWDAFNDLERIAPCFPGASLTSYDGNDFAGLVKVKLGPISLQYTGTGTFVERDVATHRAVIEAKGKDKRGNGTAAASVTTQLLARDDGATDVEVVTTLNITGRPAQFGRGVMQDVSDKLLGQFASCLETKLGPSAAGEEAPGAGAPAEEPVAAQPDNAEKAEVETSVPAKKAPAKKVPAKKVPAKKTLAKKTAAAAKKSAAPVKKSAAKKVAATTGPAEVSAAPDSPPSRRARDRPRLPRRAGPPPHPHPGLRPRHRPSSTSARRCCRSC